MTIPIMGDLPRFPMRHITPNIVVMMVRLTVGSGPALNVDRADCSVTDETGTGAYKLHFPPCTGASVIPTIMVAGGTSTKLLQVIGTAIPASTSGEWAFATYLQTVSGGTVALGDLVAGDIIDFHVFAKAVSS